MRSFRDRHSVLSAACAALSGLTFNNVRGQEIVAENGGVSAVIDAMKSCDRPRLQENGCLAIGTMCWHTELKSAVVALGGTSVVLRALERHYLLPGVAKNGCRAIAQIAFNCEKFSDFVDGTSMTFGPDVRMENIIQLLIKVMLQHPHHDRTQMHCCAALSVLCWASPQNAKILLDFDGYAAVVEAARLHPHNSDIQLHACRVFSNVSAVPLNDCFAATQQICSAMERFPSAADVQEEACRALVALSLNSIRNKDKMLECHAAELVIEAIRRFPESTSIQQEACNALAHLAYEHQALNMRVTELNGVQVLLDTMRAYPNNLKILLNACGGLSAAAFDNPKAQVQIFESQGAQLVVRAMEMSEKTRMLELGCSLLGTLAWNSSIKEKVAEFALPAIIRVLAHMKDNPLLQKSACRAISQFAFNSESNRKLLMDMQCVPLVVGSIQIHYRHEKLVAHALKALTYLCWESEEVAQIIVEERIFNVLSKIQEYHKSNERIVNESAHLIKILQRKGSAPTLNATAAASMTAPPRGYPVSPLGMLSPPIQGSPALPETTKSPKMADYPRALPPPSPPIVNAPAEVNIPRRSGRDGTAQSIAFEGLGRRGEISRGEAHVAHGGVEERRRGDCRASAGGGDTHPQLRNGRDPQYSDPPKGLSKDFRFEQPPVQRHQRRHDDPWDDPSPQSVHSVHGAAEGGLNWQQRQLLGRPSQSGDRSNCTPEAASRDSCNAHDPESSARRRRRHRRR
jgi:hypothetical protein